MKLLIIPYDLKHNKSKYPYLPLLVFTTYSWKRATVLLEKKSFPLGFHIYSPSPFHFMSHVMYECLPFQTQQTEVDIIIMS